MTDPTRRPERDDDAGRAEHHDAPDTHRNAATDPAAKRSTPEAQEGAVKAASPPAGAAAGAIAGATAGLATGVFGPIGAMVGAVLGAVGGAAAGTVGGQAAANDLYTEQDDAHYRALWDAQLDRPADRGFESARVAYQFGHIAAHNPEFAGARFADIEPELRRRWPNELRAHAGEWDAVRTYVEDAYGYARSRGAGERRDPTIVGSAGSAVDPVERDRARAGLPSTPDTPDTPDTRT
jgi:hypothetical protein